MIAPHDFNESIVQLVRVAARSEAAFHAAVAAAGSDEVRALLLDRAYRYTRAAAAFRSLARGLGLDASPLADAGIAFPGPLDDIALLAECERREDAAIVALRDALEATLPPEVRRTVEREFDSLLAPLGSLRSLRERLAGRAQPEPAPAAHTM
jgi:hypothetical protein